MPRSAPSGTQDDLERALARIDGRAYGAYQEVKGRWRMRGFGLAIDHVQGDPFAAPSLARVLVPAERARLLPSWSRTRTRRVALQDLLARAARAAAERAARRRGSGGSGAIRVDAGGQEVLERTACRVHPDGAVELRLAVGLPAKGRRVLGAQARALLADDLALVAGALVADALDGTEVEDFVACVENQEAVRAGLRERGWIAFVGDGALLPRESGASDRPMAGAVPFEAPAALRVAVPIPNPERRGGREVREWTGLAIPRGVTVIVGGGYHGKSTLLRALERGVAPHVPGDGRERVVADASLAKVRAEDGRSVRGADIAPYIANLPDGRDTSRFSSDDASGSTSQAAAVVEAIEAGARGLLMDEDTSATNFMVRDARMRALVEDALEPITPFSRRVRALRDDLGVSTVLVMGGSGAYLGAADLVLRMIAYRPEDATARAREVAAAHPDAGPAAPSGPLPPPAPRAPVGRSLDPRLADERGRVRTRGLRLVSYGGTELDLGGLEQLLDESQTRAVAEALRHLSRRADGRRPLASLLDELDALLDEEGLEVLAYREGGHPGDLARPRTLEVAGAVNRLRTLEVGGGS